MPCVRTLALAPCGWDLFEWVTTGEARSEESMSIARRVVLTSAAGYGATAVMDRVTTALYERQSEESRNREREVQPEPAVRVLVRKMADATDRSVDGDQVKVLGNVVHRGMGIGGAYLAGILLARGWKAIPAGMAAGMVIWLVFDEGLNYVLGLTAPATEFPRESHLRGLLGHMAYGAALGGLLTIARRLWKS
jgi:uncharacterized membrane protein YagU involved in acid resistance